MRMLFHCRNIVTIHTVPLPSDDATSYFSNGVKMSFLSVVNICRILTVARYVSSALYVLSPYNAAMKQGL